MSQGIEITLNGLTFEVPTASQHDWANLTDWILEANETLSATGDSFVIPAGTANLSDGVAVDLYTVNDPQDNANIIFEYGIIRRTTGGGATSKSETGSVYLAYDSTTGEWLSTNVSVGDAEVVLGISGGNVIQAIAVALTGTPSVSQISYKGRIIRT